MCSRCAVSALAMCLLFGNAALGAAVPTTHPSPKTVWSDPTKVPAPQFILETSKPPTILPRRLDDSAPIAPLPPALFIGPMGIAMVGWASYRLRKRGRI